MGNVGSSLLCVYMILFGFNEITSNMYIYIFLFLFLFLFFFFFFFFLF